MDVCTLATVTVMSAVGCATYPACHDSADGTHRFCTPAIATACPVPELRYDCVRPDGAHYGLPASADQTIMGPG